MKNLLFDYLVRNKPLGINYVGEYDYNQNQEIEYQSYNKQIDIDLFLIKINEKKKHVDKLNDGEKKEN
jgi:hypothetical protein